MLHNFQSHCTLATSPSLVWIVSVRTFCRAFGGSLNVANASTNSRATLSGNEPVNHNSKLRNSLVEGAPCHRSNQRLFQHFSPKRKRVLMPLPLPLLPLCRIVHRNSNSNNNNNTPRQVLHHQSQLLHSQILLLPVALHRACVIPNDGPIVAACLLVCYRLLLPKWVYLALLLSLLLVAAAVVAVAVRVRIVCVHLAALQSRHLLPLQPPSRQYQA
jgi:hypothetical protein